jgi:hypothetical protein
MADTPKLDYVNDLPGFQKNNPQYYDDPAIDQLMSIVLDLGAEMWVMRDRQAMMEELLETKGSVTREDLDKGRPSENLAERLEQERQEFIRRVYGRLFASYGGDKAEFKGVF